MSTKIKYESVIKKPVTFKAFNCLYYCGGLYVCICSVWACVEDQQMITWGNQFSPTTVLVPGIELRLPGLAAGAFTLRAISPTPYDNFKQIKPGLVAQVYHSNYLRS